MSVPVHYLNQLPSSGWLKRQLGLPAQTSLLIIFDRCLKGKGSFTSWVKQFPHRYGVAAGEKLKAVEHFSQHVRRLNKVVGELPTSQLVVVAVGGGSVGDFAGFFASVYKRGVTLVHVPSTWLAAIDSAHGGKTGLNLGGIKNQIGTFHSGSLIVVCRELLATQDRAHRRAAFAELFKVALISGGTLYRATCQLVDLSTDSLWKVLPLAVTAKNKIVARDPLEKRGDRQLLNLGHTVGHVLEAFYQLPHGQAVALGLKFAVEWSRSLGKVSQRASEQIQAELEVRLDLSPMEKQLRRRKRLPTITLTRLLLRDKKLSGAGQVVFVFPEKVGRVRRQRVAVAAIVREMRRQGWK